MNVLDRVMNCRLTIAEWIGAALLLAVPYGVAGLLWSFWHLGQLTALTFVTSTMSWPVLLFGNGCIA